MMSLQWEKNGEALNKSIGWAAGEKKLFVISTKGRNLGFVHYIPCFQMSADGRNGNIVHEDSAWTY